MTLGRPRPINTAVLLRDAFVALNDLVINALGREGHPEIRPAHAAVFQYLDDDGTTVSALAERAQMTKQAMGELVLRLEGMGYLERVADPTDRRAKLVRPTARGRAVIVIAQREGEELERRLAALLGRERLGRLTDDLATIYEQATGDWAR